jgi:hypothetical protein
VDSEGRKFSTNTEADGRFHSKWMNMMYPRLFLARNLLRQDGVIFISIDDAEFDNLKKLAVRYLVRKILSALSYGSTVFNQKAMLGSFLFTIITFSVFENLTHSISRTWSERRNTTKITLILTMILKDRGGLEMFGTRCIVQISFTI